MTAISRRSFIFMSLALAACKRGAADMLLSGQTMGTTYSVVAVQRHSDVKQSDLRSAIESTLAAVDGQMSNWNPRSEISRINGHPANVPFSLSPEMESLLNAAQIVHDSSDGQFDLTLGPLIELWGFGATTSPGSVPEDQQIEQALAVTGQSRALQFASGKLSKAHNDTKLYLSAIGKGFGVDRVADTLKGFGITDFMVEIGGDIVTSGQNAEGQPWQIAIETPELGQQRVHQLLGVSDFGMATSGDYRNYFEQGGQRYSHILNAHAGLPVEHDTASVTVLAENAMLADAWATALLALGQSRGLEIAREQNLAAYFIDRSREADKNAFVSSASPRFVEIQAS